jgi:hypothetical protein
MTYFNWKKKYEGLLPDKMQRLKLLEDESAKLKKLVDPAPHLSRNERSTGHTGRTRDWRI